MDVSSLNEESLTKLDDCHDRDLIIQINYVRFPKWIADIVNRSET